MNNLDVVITGAQGEGKSRLARDIMRQVLPSASRAKDFADIDDLLEWDLSTKHLKEDKLLNLKPTFILFDSVLEESIPKAQKLVSLYRGIVKKPVFAIYVKHALLVLILSLSFMSCSRNLEPKYFGCVEQEIKQGQYTGEAPRLYTYVWYQDHIVSAESDAVNSINDSIATLRKNEGLALIKTIKELNIKPVTLFK